MPLFGVQSEGPTFVCVFNQRGGSGAHFTPEQRRCLEFLLWPFRFSLNGGTSWSERDKFTHTYTRSLDSWLICGIVRLSTGSAVTWSCLQITSKLSMLLNTNGRSCQQQWSQCERVSIQIKGDLGLGLPSLQDSCIPKDKQTWFYIHTGCPTNSHLDYLHFYNSLMSTFIFTFVLFILIYQQQNCENFAICATTHSGFSATSVSSISITIPLYSLWFLYIPAGRMTALWSLDSPGHWGPS